MLNQPHPSKRRDTLIANIFFRIGYIEAWRRGILLILEKMQKAGLPQPSIVEYAGGIQATRTKAIEGKKNTVEKISEAIKTNAGVTIKRLQTITCLSRWGVEGLDQKQI